MAGKSILGVAKLYKGVLIFKCEDGFVIFNALGQRLIFSSELAAMTYVDEPTAKSFSLN